MTALRSRRLEALFGKTLDSLTSTDIKSLVTNEVTEAFDIEFKEFLYGNSDQERRDLSGDIAALANTAGGIIILGISENDHAVAQSAPGVHLGDAETQRMRQITASLTAPLPTFDILPIAIPDEDPLGYYLIAVPRSNAAPHAVLINNGLRYPKRNGSTTRYLSEAEVASAYRDRLRRLDLQADRISNVLSDALLRLDCARESWLTVTLVPDLPGAMEITSATFKSFTTEIIDSPSTEIAGQQVASFRKTSVGRGRLVAFDSAGPGAKDSWISAQFHADGSGAYSVGIHDLADQNSTTPNAGFARVLSEESIVDGVISGILHLARHAQNRAAAGGNAIIQLQVVPQEPWLPTTLGHMRGGLGTVRTSGSTSIGGRMLPVEIVTPLDAVAQPGPELVASAASAVNQLSQVFGLPELGQLTTDGQFRRQYWGRHWQALVAGWALPASVEVIEDTLQ